MPGRRIKKKNDNTASTGSTMKWENMISVERGQEGTTGPPGEFPALFNF